MLKKLSGCLIAASVAFTALPVFAQDEPEEARTTYRIEYLKLKPGQEDRWVEMGEKYWEPATKAAGYPMPAIHWMMSGPWHIMMVQKLPRGLAMLDAHNPPERKRFREEFEKIAGSKEEAEKLMAEDGEIVTDSLVVFSHTHP